MISQHTTSTVLNGWNALAVQRLNRIGFSRLAQTTGTETLVTVNSGKRAHLGSVSFFNSGTGSATVVLNFVKDGVTYTLYAPSALATGASITFGGSPYFMIEEGNALSVTVTGTNVSVNSFGSICEFDSSVPYTSKVFTAFTGNNDTVYTCPSGKQFSPSRSGTNDWQYGASGAWIFNKSGGTRTYTVWLVPSGQSVGDSTKIYTATTLADGGIYFIGNNIGGYVFSAGDSIVIDSDSNASGQLFVINGTELNVAET